MSLDCYIVTFRTSYKECETPVNAWQEAGVFESKEDATKCYASIALSGSCTGKQMLTFNVIDGCSTKNHTYDSSYNPEPCSTFEKAEVASLKQAVTNAVEAYFLSVQRERYTTEMDEHAKLHGG